ncbi:hypothetical protein AAKU67_001487 [Oxalobacteraceae bacterium GrIS 2.11]
MSISALNSSQQVAYTQFNPGQSVNKQSSSSAVPTAADYDGGGGSFFKAISSALTQLGINPTSSDSSTTSSTSASAAADSTSTASTSSSQSPQQALQSFIQSLFAAIQSEVGGGQSSGSSAQGISDGGHRHHHGAGTGKLEAGIQDLINQLSAASGSTPTSGTSGTTASTAVSGVAASSGSSNALSALQTSFNNLLSTDGIAGSNTSLTGFLQSLESKLQGSSVSGNVVKTQA